VNALSVGLSRLNRKLGAGQTLEPDVNSLQQQTADISNDIARISHQLRPIILQKLGLPLALRRLCEQSANSDGIIQCTALDEIPRLSEIASISLYRIAQEALRNALTHSAATRITVELSASDEAVTLNITDNGTGFVVESLKTTGLGLSGMIERMNNVGGTLSVRSRPGEGTIVLATIPLQKSIGVASGA
jgi:two-component system NarL family sensor kinase